MKGSLKKYYINGYYNGLKCVNKHGASLLHTAIFYDSNYNDNNKPLSRLNMITKL